MKKRLILLLLTLITSGCASKYRVQPDAQYVPLKNNEGYLGLVFNSLDSLRSIQLKNTESGEEFYIGGAPKGISQITLQLPENEYCLVGFDVYNYRIDYEDQGFCTFVEAGELNYFGHFIVRNPLTTTFQAYKGYVFLLGLELPKICQELVNDECKI